ncbi:hypothetical protein BSKO_02425 [Bryopsis sp. KO-2023]|nr:hypothetical protein BSKO_02425 [Bryopsis sp. KO-2023]
MSNQTPQLPRIPPQEEERVEENQLLPVVREPEEDQDLGQESKKSLEKPGDKYDEKIEVVLNLEVQNQIQNAQSHLKEEYEDTFLSVRKEVQKLVEHNAEVVKRQQQMLDKQQELLEEKIGSFPRTDNNPLEKFDNKEMLNAQIARLQEKAADKAEEEKQRDKLRAEQILALQTTITEMVGGMNLQQETIGELVNTVIKSRDEQENCQNQLCQLTDMVNESLNVLQNMEQAEEQIRQWRAD